MAAMKVMKKAGKATKVPRTVDKKGLAAARRATTMTSEEWKKLQVGMAAKWPAPEYMKDGHREGKGHTAYRDETFELMTRMKADTKVSYRPHAKRPGSKSHPRYEGYMKSKTAAQALHNGAWPADWCWDFERGFLQVDKKTLRSEPIDVSQVTDDATLTDVDRAVFQWYRRELAKTLGLKLEDLILDKGSQETTIMRAHRLVAQRECVAVLKSCKKEKRMVTDAELTKVLMQWGFARNGTRLNVMREGQKWVFSDTLGLLVDRTQDIHPTQGSVKYPEVVQVMNKWLTDRLPAEAKNFTWSSINVNKNYAASVHRDGNNFGPSMISAFGDFTGGLLNYYPTDDGKGEPEDVEAREKAVKIDLKNGLAHFNAHTAHSVDDFKNNRFTVVYFTIGCHDQMSKDCRKQLCDLGFYVPARDQDPYRLLCPPPQAKRYKQRVPASPAQAKRARLPSSRYWPKTELVKGRK